MKLRILLYLLLCTPLLLAAQPKNLDSLLARLRTVRADTDKADAYLHLSIFYLNKNNDSCLLMAQNSLSFSTRASFKKGIVRADMMVGITYEYQGKYPEALQYDLQALTIAETAGLGSLSRKTMNNIAMIYTDIGNYSNALAYFRRALEAGLRDPKDTAHLYIGAHLVNIASTFTKMGQYDSAIAYGRQGLAVAVKNHDTTLIALGWENIGENYLKKGQFAEALGPLEKSLQAAVAAQEQTIIVSVELDFAEIDLNLEKYSRSIYYAATALSQAEKIDIKEAIRDGCHLLYKSYSHLGDYRQALYYRDREIDLNDSLLNEKNRKKITVLQSDYDLAKKQQQIELLNKDKIIREKKLASDRLLRNLIIAIALSTGLCCVFLLRSNAKNRRLNKVKNKMFSIIGHDLRGPFRKLQALVYLLETSDLSKEEIHDYTSKIKGSIENTSHLLDNLLTWARTQMKGIHLSPGIFDVNELIAENLKLIMDRADKKNIAISYEDNVSCVYVYADERTIDIVIRNLLENAIKFCRAGDNIDITTAIDSVFTMVKITDNGRGIARERQYDLFSGSGYTTLGTANEIGSGLGLPLCKELVEKNGGRIGFESKAKQYTSFFFTLPTAKI